MVVAFIFFLLFFFLKKIKRYPLKLKILIFSFLAIYIVGMFLYTQFLISKGWKYGIPGADMKAHYDAAYYISKGHKWKELYGLTGADRFIISIGTFSYYVYSLITAILLFSPTIINMQVTLYLLYFCQILITFLCVINFSEFFEKKFKNVKKEYMFIACFSFISFAIQSYQLMRDVYLMYFLSLFFVSLNLEDKLKNYILSAILICLCFLFRTYSIIVTIPMMIYYKVNKKIAIVASVAAAVILYFNLPILELFTKSTNITWELQKADIKEVVKFILFPNIINQFKYLLHWNKYFGGETYEAGCNLPGVYFVSSLWNIIIYFFCLIGIFKKEKSKLLNIVFWGMVLVDIALLYSINYQLIDTRHRLMMFPSLMMISLYGVSKIKFLKKDENYDGELYE